MLFNKIKQNLAGFAAVAIAFTGLTAIAPANAAYAPTITASVEQSGDVVILSLSQQYDPAGVGRVPFPFSLSVDGQSWSVAGIDTSRPTTQVGLFLNSRIDQGATVTLNYDATNQGWLKNSSNEFLASFSGLAVTNNSTYLPLTNNARPTVTGNPTAFQTLTATPGVWTPVNASVTGLWYLCTAPVSAGTSSQQPSGCVGIGGQTNLTYTLTSQDVGKYLMYREMATQYGVNSYANSATTAVVAAAQQQQQQQQQQSSLTLQNPAVLSGTGVAGTAASVVPSTWTTAGVPSQYWVSCSQAYTNYVTRPNLSPALNTCFPVYPTQAAAQSPTYQNIPTSFAIPADGMVWQRLCNQGQNCTVSSVSMSGKYLGWVELDNNGQNYGGIVVTFSSVVSGGSSQNNQQVVQNNNSNTIPTTVPIIRPNVSLSQNVRAGGTLTIEAANVDSVSEVKIGDVGATLKPVSGGLEIQVPTGLTPGAKDLLIKTATGSVLHIGAVKIADPVLEAQKLAYAKAASSVALRAPIDLTVSGSRPSAKQINEARQHAAEYKTAKEAVCVAVPSSKTNAASARAAAAAVCAAMKAVNPRLKVTVIVEAPSGARSNVVSSELIG